jgi:hypothetical protein
MSVPFTYPRGEAIIVDLVIADAGDYDPATLDVTMSLKITYNLEPPPVTVAPVAVFAVTYHAATGGNPAYWEGVIDADTSAALQPASYITDAQIVSAGSTISVTSPQVINIVPSVTPAA